MKIEEMLVCCDVRISKLDSESLLLAEKIVNNYAKSDYLDDYLFNLYHALKDFDIELKDLVKK